MSKIAIQLLLVVVVIAGLVAWTQPQVRQKAESAATQTSASFKVAISATTNWFSQADARIRAYFQAHPMASIKIRVAPLPKFNVQTFFNNLGRQTTQWIDSLVVWFKTTFHMAADLKPQAPDFL